MKTIFTFIFITTIILTSLGQRHGYGGHNRGNMPKDAVITGKVVDQNTKKPIEFANVAVYKKRDSSVVTGVIADQNGKFKIENLPYGRYYISADFIGFHKKFISDIKLFPKRKIYDCKTIELKIADENIDEIEVNAERNNIEFKIDRKVLNISKNENAAGGNIVDAIENAPSINVDIDGNVTLRGSSSFLVLIDGKPSVLDANDVLQQMPASAVENVEIITNPSAKFDPDGTSGIINIILKKTHKSGFSGVINASYGTWNKYSGDFLFNYRTQKFNVFLGANYRNYLSEGSAIVDRETYRNDTTSFLHTESVRERYMSPYSLNGGIDFYINKKNTLTVSGNVGEFIFNRNLYSSNHEYSLPETEDIYSASEGKFGVQGKYYKTNIDYRLEFAKKGHELTASASYSNRGGGITTNVMEQQTDLNYVSIGEPYETEDFQDMSKTKMLVKIDYTLPINEMFKLETGYQMRLTNAGGDYIVKYFDAASNSWSVDNEKTNELTYLRDIHSIYTSLSGKVGKFQYMAGLRGEYTDRLIDQKTTEQKYPVKLYDYYPTLHLSYPISENNQIQASYSKRVRRPRHWYLNPFPKYSDSYTTRIGNPELLPEQINSYELSYQTYIKKNQIVLTGYYRQTTNGIDRIQTLQDDGTILMTFGNISNTFAYGAELSGNIQLFKWWRLYANTNLFRYNIEDDLTNSSEIIYSTNYDFKINSTFIFKKMTRLQINAMYHGPSITAQGYREQMFMVDFAVRQDLFRRKLSIVLRVRDPFNLGKHDFTVEGDNYVIHNVMRREPRVFMLALSYRINNYKKKRGKKDSGDYEGI